MSVLLWVGRVESLIKPQNVAYRSFLCRSPALLSPGAEMARNPASATKATGHDLPICRAGTDRARSLNATTMGHPHGHADPHGRVDPGHGQRVRLRRHHEYQTRRA